MPRDLYIPPQAMEVFLDAFEGPLDLLLYLIRRQNLNILDIPIAEITRQYTQYIDVMTEMQLDLAGEYLVMAATLAEIKSRMLLPGPPAAAKAKTIRRRRNQRRLQEYERFSAPRSISKTCTRVDRDTFPAGRTRRAASRPAAAERLAAGDAGRPQGRAGARRNVRAPSHQPRTAVGAPAHVRGAGRDALAGVRRIRHAVPR
jgi:chromatin segregation and condensation protein Rec8/ScpA/Scc1 (kleisin family)